MNKETFVTKGLTNYDEFDHFFELHTIDDDAAFPLREARRKITEKFDAIVKVLDTVLQPDTSLVDLKHSEAFSNDERNAMIPIYKQLMRDIARSNELSLDDSDALNLAYLSEALATYKRSLPAVKKWFGQMTHAWVQDAPATKEAKYFG